MPWEPRICYYCDKKYANRQGLRTHLGRYVGEWRLPADGVHDALEIDQILNPERHEPEYKCPDCSLIITPRSKFVGHLVYRHNYENHVHGRDPAWPFAFGEDEVKVFQPEGPFPFLRLPFGECFHLLLHRNWQSTPPFSNKCWDQISDTWCTRISSGSRESGLDPKQKYRSVNRIEMEVGSSVTRITIP